MTSDAVPAGGDPRRLLADVRGLARRVRLAQRVTWLPLLVLALVTFGAIPIHLFFRWHVSDCRPIADGEICKGWFPAGQFYWLAAAVVAYVVIAGGYLRVARSRGVGARVLPYVLTGVVLAVVLFAAVAVGAGAWIFPDGEARALVHPSAFVQVVFRLLDPTGGIGMALLVLAWLERHVALLLFTLVYLTVILVPINFGWEGFSQFQFVPMLTIGGGVLLLGSIGFARAQRPLR